MRLIFFLMTCTLLCSCSLFKKKNVFQITSGHELYLEDEQGLNQKINAGEITPVHSSFIRLTSPGKIPLYLIFAPKDSEAAINIDLMPLAAWKPEDVDQYIDQTVKKVATQIMTIYEYSPSQNISELESIINDLLKEFPKLHVAYYLKAQLEIIKGDKTRAHNALDQALALEPSFIPAQRLITAIGDEK
ncbi:MAG: hypothetical protein HQK50_08760 [Oligoflexia bacterium]|nr:hypothetical protein [Oligoflexia bacterium]MBF0365649.1 hypothetical protein [Oligoflexia bacterium]